MLSIGEGGGAGLYGTTELGVPKYPRKQFFDECVAVMREADRFVPLFNDKHLSYSWEHAKEMHDTAASHGFGLMAGSSVVLAHRLPQLGDDIDAGEARITEAVAIHGGPMESYDFHGCELLQCIVESRPSGNSAGRGLRSVQLVEGDALWAAVDSGRINEGLVRAAMACEDRVEGTTTAAEWRELRPSDSDDLVTSDAPPHALLLDFADGLRGTVLRVGDDNARWNFACQVAGESEPRATRVVVGPW